MGFQYPVPLWEFGGDPVDTGRRGAYSIINDSFEEVHTSSKTRGFK